MRTLVLAAAVGIGGFALGYSRHPRPAAAQATRDVAAERIAKTLDDINLTLKTELGAMGNSLAEINGVVDQAVTAQLSTFSKAQMRKFVVFAEEVRSQRRAMGR